MAKARQRNVGPRHGRIADRGRGISLCPMSGEREIIDKRRECEARHQGRRSSHNIHSHCYGCQRVQSRLRNTGGTAYLFLPRGPGTAEVNVVHISRQHRFRVS